jgi:hypothetical protein
MVPHHLIDPDEAEILLTAELRSVLYTSECQAWAVCREWPQRFPEFVLNDGCFAHVMNQAITTFARRNLADLAAEGVIDLDDEPGFLMVRLRPVSYVPSHKTLGLKFNKLDSNLHPSGNRTFQNASIFGQQFLFEEPNSTTVSATVATVGWCASPSSENEPEFAIACNMDGHLLWSIPLLPPPAIGTLPIPEVQPPQGGPVVRSANEDAQKERRAE